MAWIAAAARRRSNCHDGTPAARNSGLVVDPTLFALLYFPLDRKEIVISGY
jgi:hypothetical protein